MFSVYIGIKVTVVIYPKFIQIFFLESFNKPDLPTGVGDGVGVRVGPMKSQKKLEPRMKIK